MLKRILLVALSAMFLSVPSPALAGAHKLIPAPPAPTATPTPVAVATPTSAPSLQAAPGSGPSSSAGVGAVLATTSFTGWDSVHGQFQIGVRVSQGPNFNAWLAASAANPLLSWPVPAGALIFHVSIEGQASYTNGIVSPGRNGVDLTSSSDAVDELHLLGVDHFCGNPNLEPQKILTSQLVNTLVQRAVVASRTR